MENFNILVFQSAPRGVALWHLGSSQGWIYPMFLLGGSFPGGIPSHLGMDSSDFCSHDP